MSLAASVDLAEVEETRTAIRATIASLRETPVDADLLDRAREPLLEGYANMLKSLGGWMSLADHAQSENERLDRYFQAEPILRSITAEDVQEMARRYLVEGEEVEVLVLPETATGPDT